MQQEGGINAKGTNFVSWPWVGTARLDTTFNFTSFRNTTWHRVVGQEIYPYRTRRILISCSRRNLKSEPHFRELQSH